MMEFKICRKCKNRKSIEDFNKNKSQNDGHLNICKECQSLEGQIYYQNHRKELLRYQKQYLKTHSEKHKESQINWYKNHPFKSWAIATIKHHQKKGVAIEISIDRLEEIAKKSTTCVICGKPLDWEYGKKKINANSPSLDRIDNESLISEFNIQILCYNCNARKRNSTMKEFIEYCKMIVTKFG